MGVAFSRLKNSEGTGYIIPYVVVQHFLECYERHGMFTGLCCLGMLMQRLENPSLRRFHKVQVNPWHAAPFSTACCTLFLAPFCGLACSCPGV